MAELTPQTLAALGLTGVAVWQVHGAYTSTGPSLHDLRNASMFDTSVRQSLMDCDVLVGILAVASGGLAWYVTRSPVPAIVILSSFLLVSGYHHLVMHGPTVEQIETGVR
jgi:hypothetical protein